jgi:anthranilate phosphoribosyltransferase
MKSETEELLKQKPKLIMRSIIQRIATGPDMSKDISREEARAGIKAIMNGDVDSVQAAVFLIAMRMKRETDEENIGILDGIRDMCRSTTADVDEVLDMSDPYNGYNRTLPAAPFMPAVMAACGVPTISHGVETMSPKFGITHHRVLRAAGVPVDLTVEQSAARLADESLGWAYVDQKSYCPELHQLTELRSGIIKRQAITTVEVLTKPIAGRKKTHFMSGYVHTPYTHVYTMLARHVGFDSCLLVRGVEGGIIPSLRQKGKVITYHDLGEEEATEITPADIGIDQNVRATPLPDDLEEILPGDDVGAPFDADLAAGMAAEAGVAALGGKTGSTYDAMVYAGAIALWHLGKSATLHDAAARVRNVIDSGKALQHFNKARA